MNCSNDGRLHVLSNEDAIKQQSDLNSYHAYGVIERSFEEIEDKEEKHNNPKTHRE